MRVEDYPPQEPLPEFALAYADEVMRRGKGVRCTDYSYGADPYQGISLQVPEKPNGTVLVLVHGGGWTCGYKEHMNFIGPSVTAANVIFASIGYRLAPGNVFPACADDVAAAIAWLHDHAGEFGGDSGRIFAGGHSAGGHLTALLAVRRDWQAARGLPDGVIRGCLPVSGAYRLGKDSGFSMRPRFLGENSENDRLASPVQNISAAPPFFMAYGEKDFPHLIDQAHEMASALRGVGGEVEETVLENCDHLGACLALGDANFPWTGAALDWMAAH